MILVTGGAGYIGSHCILALLEQGIEVLCFDNLSTGNKKIIEILEQVSKKYGQSKFYFIQGDLLNLEEVNSIFRNKIDAVIHFAAFSQVEESIKNPQKYYINNVCGTLNLLERMLENNVKKIVFSSTAAIYGNPQYIPIDELHPKNPINPYGQTKLMIENFMNDYDKAYGLKSICLRYFNVVGADSDIRIGEWHEPETHLIPNILKTSYSNDVFSIYGNDYNTKDGTCIRDYINIEDLVNAHILSLEYLLKGGNSDCFNLGTNNGNSVKEVFEICNKITNKNIAVKIADKRDGDPESLISDINKAQTILKWKPEKNLEYSIKTAYNWNLKLQDIKNSEVLINA